MSFDRKFASIRGLALAGMASLVGYAAATDLSTTPLSTYSVTSSSDVKPNVLFLLDDSGSMDWDFMPDWACASYSTTQSDCNFNGQHPNSDRSEYLFRNPSYNGIYYNPAVRYLPPVAVSSSGTVSASGNSTYPSQTGVSTATGGDSGASSGSPNWNAVKNDAYSVQRTSTSNLTPTASSTTPGRYYTTIAGEYCTSSSLKTCTTASAASTSYPFPAPVRWCNSSGTSCQAAFSSTNTYVRAPVPRTTSFTVNTVANNATITDITVGSYKILPATITATSSTTSTFANQIAAAINQCNGTKVLVCTAAGFAATVSGSTVTITAGPVATLTAPSVTKNGTLTLSALNDFSANTVPGYTILSIIVPGTTAAYPFPGDTGTTPVKAGTRADCSGTTCTGNEEMINYANWWTYYSTRMQMMKTAASNAFAAIDTGTDIAAGKSRYRVGYMTLNNNGSTDLVNLAEFTGTQKFTWYSRLLKARPGNSTPLRARLADAGRLYGGRLNGTTYNGVTVTDPMQYYCQRNYTILSTDGFWNGDAGYKLDGSTPVSNQDAGLPAPYGDGGTSTLQARTSRLQTSTATLTNQYRNSYLQTRTKTTANSSGPYPNLQRRVTSNGNSSTPTWTEWADAASCNYDNSGNNRVDCRISQATSNDAGVTWSGWTTVTSCTPDFSGDSRTQCGGTITTTTYGNWTDSTATCTTSSTVECRYNQPTSSYTNTTDNAACTPVTASPSSPYTVLTAVECNQNIGAFSAYADASSTCTTSSTVHCQYTPWSSWGGADTCTAAPQSSSSPYTQLTATQCQTLTTAGNSDTLADVAQYYYNTDLRTATPNSSADSTGTCSSSTNYDLCANKVPTGGARDTQTQQHMTTFTLGLGAQGRMIFSPTNTVSNDYWADTSGDFFSVLNRATANTTSGVCSWQTSGLCYWPTPAADSNANIDDLWHAAINGRGTYFSAKDPTSLATGLASTLNNIPAQPRDGTSAAAASSNPNVTTTDNFVFSSSYRSMAWTGELTRKIIASNGTLSDPNWYASRLVDCATTVWAPNTVYSPNSAFRYPNSSGTCYYVKATVSYTSGASFDFGSSGAEGINTTIVHADETATILVAVVPDTTRKIVTNISGELVDFVDSNTSLQATFATTNWQPNLSQFCSTGSGCVSNTSGATAQTLINYLRGDRTNEGTYYRPRINVLGDIVASESRYVKAPLQNYTDSGFSAFKTTMASRTGMVYVGANDGMLHAFNATTGKEAWAYIPSRVVSGLYKLADTNYANNHQYFVDGTPSIAEVYGPCRSGITGCSTNEWRTILVGGLNGGGKGYYALDITDPTTPIFLWEFTDTNMGYTYGNPKITKLKNGKWVVLLTSGYNTADGKSHLYIRNAIDGSTTGLGASQIDTGVTGEIGRMDSRALSPDTDNTSIAAYAGDTSGNLWRFDINGDIGATGFDAQRLVSLKDVDGLAQPITAKPEMATVNGLTMVYVGTGKYLGVTDITNAKYQAFYGVVDRSNAAALVSPRDTGSNFVQQVLTNGTCPTGTPSSICASGDAVKTSTANAVDWATKDGWYVDFLTAGERSVTDATLVLGTVLFTSITPTLPTSDPCSNSTAGGNSYLYALNYATGGSVTGSNGVVGTSLGAIIATRPVAIKLQSGVIETLTQGTAGVGLKVSTVISTPPIYTSGAGVRRISWRELTSQ